jgi:23S rRNA (guanine1835-N2)-methyltransferase
MDSLKRYPIRKNDLLRAWDSADELILQHVNSLELQDKRILIVNDHFGALSKGLRGHNITSLTDSFISFQATKLNTNGEIVPVNNFKELWGHYDFVLIQLPKNLSYLEDILCHLTLHLHQRSKIICASMIKHLAPGSFDLLQKYIGPTTTSLAQKKARLIFSSFEKGVVSSPYPLHVQLDGFSKSFVNGSNLFSRERLDIGTRFLLENMPKGNFKSILDLGCANGVVGIKAKMLYTQASIIFSDESFLALESAKTNYQNHFEDEAQYHWTNCYETGVKSSLDLVLCNPPFHQSNTIGDFIAWQMFNDAKNALKKGGLLRVIGNTHLGYQVKLKKIFGNSEIVAKNKKFMIIDAIS